MGNHTKTGLRDQTSETGFFQLLKFVYDRFYHYVSEILPVRDLAMWLKAVYERCENSCWPQVHAYAWSGEQRFGDFFPLLSLLSLCCSIRQMTTICFPFFSITIIRVILFILLNYWNLTIFLATGKSDELFRGTYFFKAKSLYSATVVSFFSRFD